MYEHANLNREEVRRLIVDGSITLGGHKGYRIYGRLDCKGGKRMLVVNRVFFLDESEAISHGYRPCGNCMREAYQQWKANGGGFPDLNGLNGSGATDGA